MLFVALCLQTSLLFSPLHTGEEPPELRSAQQILILHDGVEGLVRKPGRSAEQAEELALELKRHIDGGADFRMLADRYSSLGPGTATLGSFVPGSLAPKLDEFLFTAELGQCSEPLETEGGVVLLRRVETRAAVRTIQVSGTGDESRERAAEIRKQLVAGADFGALAKEHSDDAVSAARDGRFAVFERGPSDVLLKAAAFELSVGEWVGPIESPIGLHFLLREAPDDYPRDLWESNFARLRVILVRHQLAGKDAPQRDPGAAQQLAQSLWSLLNEGRDFAELARSFDEDTGGKERAGDLGWVHRRAPNLPPYLATGFLLEPGEYGEPVGTAVGVVIVMREE